MGKNRWILILLFTAVGGISKARGAESASYPVARLLVEGAGARWEALGGASVAASEDAAALQNNPAGLAFQRSGNATAFHVDQLNTSYFDFAAVGFPLWRGGVAGGVYFHSPGTIENLSANGTSLGRITPSDLAVSLGYGVRIKGWGVGLSGKHIRSKLTQSARTQAIDIGVRSPAWFHQKMRWGASIGNLGPGLVYKNLEFPLPRQKRIGTSLSLLPGTMMVVEGIFPDHGKTQMGSGVEVQKKIGKKMAVAMRGGYSSQSLSGQQGFRMGLGFQFGGLEVDYGIKFLENLDSGHLLSMTYHFNPKIPNVTN